MRTLSIVTFIVLALTVAEPAYAQTQRCGMYQCLDSNGNPGFQNASYSDSVLPTTNCKHWQPYGKYPAGKPKLYSAFKCKDGDNPNQNKEKPPSIFKESKNPSAVRRPRTSSRSSSGSSSGGKVSAGLQDRMDLYEPYVEEAASTYEIPETFIRAVIRVESSFQYKAVSGAGAEGLMQLMPGTARSMGVNDSFDPRQNILGGTRFLRVLANKYDGDMVKVLAAYNAGAGAVKKKGGIPYEGTEGYVRAVLDHYYRYKALSGDE